MEFSLLPPAVIIPVDKVRDNFQGMSYGPLITVRKDKMGDLGLKKHELRHAIQFWAYGLVSLVVAAYIYIFNLDPIMYCYTVVPLSLHGILYAVFPAYKLRAEVEAYKEQLGYYSDDRTDLFAMFIAKGYGLTVDEAEVKKMLQE